MGCSFSVVLPSLLAAFFVVIGPAYPLSLNSAFLSPSIATQGNISTGASSVDCDAARYGSNLRWSSVLSAVEKVSEDPAPLIFGMRGPAEEPGWNVILPHRIISDDGMVFVDIATINNERLLDTSSWSEISDAATRIVRTCFKSAVPEGGSVTEIGKEGLLTVTVSSYDNRKIRCFDPASVQLAAPGYESCKSILDMLPYIENEIPFGDASSPLSHIDLPKTIPSKDRQCALRIEIRPGYDLISWASLWAAAVAAEEMCVLQGRLGFAIDLGEAQKLSLGFLKPSVAIGSNILNLTLETTGSNLTIY